jgi:hypothetical protein
MPDVHRLHWLDLDIDPAVKWLTHLERYPLVRPD